MSEKIDLFGVYNREKTQTAHNFIEHQGLISIDMFLDQLASRCEMELILV